PGMQRPGGMMQTGYHKPHATMDLSDDGGPSQSSDDGGIAPLRSRSSQPLPGMIPGTTWARQAAPAMASVQPQQVQTEQPAAQQATPPAPASAPPTAAPAKTTNQA
ncbi:MAG TPA: hypothetical protein VGO93_20775, partial [Candidatus Xenobia bacterium]